MFGRFLAPSLIATLISAAASQALAAEASQRFLVTVGSAGYGHVSITETGKARGLFRLNGKASSFASAIENGRFSVSAQAGGGKRFQCEFAVSSELAAASSALGGEPVAVIAQAFLDAPTSFGVGQLPVSVSVRTAAARNIFEGSLTPAGKFLSASSTRVALSAKCDKKTGIVSGKFGASPLIGIVTGDLLTARCDNGTRISIRATGAPVIAQPKIRETKRPAPIENDSGFSGGNVITLVSIGADGRAQAPAASLRSTLGSLTSASGNSASDSTENAGVTLGGTTRAPDLNLSGNTSIAPFNAGGLTTVAFNPPQTSDVTSGTFILNTAENSTPYAVASSGAYSSPGGISGFYVGYAGTGIASPAPIALDTSFIPTTGGTANTTISGIVSNSGGALVKNGSLTLSGSFSGAVSGTTAGMNVSGAVLVVNSAGLTGRTLLPGNSDQFRITSSVTINPSTFSNASAPQVNITIAAGLLGYTDALGTFFTRPIGNSPEADWVLLKEGDTAGFAGRNSVIHYEQ